MPSTGIWAGIGSALAFIFGLISMALGHETITLWVNKIQGFFSPYIQITVPEYGAGRYERSILYAAVEAYLYEVCGTRVRKLTAELGSYTKEPLFYVDDGQQIIDIYAHGDGDRSGGGAGTATVWWHAYKTASSTNNRQREEDRRFFRVSFHRRFRELVVKEYLPHVIEKGRGAIAEKRQQRLYTNSSDCSWSYAAFQHPATFDKLAMDPMLKQKIIADLDAFKSRKEYYAKVGKAWKRGYLLFGPPGTGKSTMVSAMANYLNYDVYDLELTAVISNNQLRRLFIQTTGKSILVIEDIDRSVNLTGGWRGFKNNQAHNKHDRQPTEEEDDGFQQLTLSGLLNFIDGLWSACGGERIIIFTTNNKDKLDPVLIRPGRMDMPIEMSYCCYEGFKVLAKNYLGDVINEHDLFERYGKIQDLLGKAKMTPADVAEHLMRTEKDAEHLLRTEKNAGALLDGLIRTLRERGEAPSKDMQEEDAVEANNVRTGGAPPASSDPF